MSFGQKLQNLRKSKGLSQEELAQMLSITRQTISKWELDQSLPEFTYIAALSDILGVSTDYLIKSEAEQCTAGAAVISGERLSQSNDGGCDKGSGYGAGERVTGGASMAANASVQRGYTYSFILGVVFTALSGLGIVVFLIMSALDPHTVYTDSAVYTGLLGYLKGTEMTPYFIALIMVFIIGIVLSVMSIVMLLNEKRKV